MTEAEAPAPAPGTEPHPLRAVVLAGGLTFEREVSLSSGTQVWEELVRPASTRRSATPTPTSCRAWRPRPPTRCSSPCTGPRGGRRPARGPRPGRRPLRRVPAAACRLAWDKPAAKSVVRSAGLSTPDWVAPHSTFRSSAPAPSSTSWSRLGLPLMVKPASGGSALGVQKVSRLEELPAAMVSCSPTATP